jgi:putative oxidoreductase
VDYLPSPSDFNLALLLLRLVIGPTFAFHGYAKIFRGGRLKGTGGWFESIGVRPGHVHARIAAGGELATGVCLSLGLLTSFAGMGLVGLMSVAFWTVHRGRGLMITREGWEYVLVLGTVGVVVAILGAGRWSLDNLLGIDLNGDTGLLISLGGGVVLAALLVGTCYRPEVPAQAASDVDTQPGNPEA